MSINAIYQGTESASWVIRDKTTARVICETYASKKVAALNTIKYEAVPILEYLQQLNRDIQQQRTHKDYINRKLED